MNQFFKAKRRCIWRHARVSRVGLGFALQIAAGAVLATALIITGGPVSSAFERPGLTPAAGAKWTQETPLYDKLYQEVLVSEKAGRLEEALKKIPAVYRADVPAGAFYATLETKKREILRALFVQEGPVKNSLAAMMFDYQDHLAAPDELLHIIQIKGDLSFERYLYTWIVREMIIKPLIDSRDPWLVSTAMFLARKNSGKVEPKELIGRWKDRPDLWDETCTCQALLLLARTAPDFLKKIDAGNPDIAREIQKLAPVKASETFVAPQLFHRMAWPVLGLTLIGASSRIWLENPKAEATTGKEKDLSAELRTRGYVNVPAGTHTLRFVSGSAGQHGEYGGMYGRSYPFRAKPGFFIRILIPVDSGV